MKCNKKQDFHNRGVFRELIDYSLELDKILKECLNNATVFQGSSKTVENEIIYSMLQLCTQGIKDQINETEFLAIQCDETIDISNQCQVVVIIRYLQNGNR